MIRGISKWGNMKRNQNLEILTIIVLTNGTRDQGITINEIIEKSNGTLSRATVHRLLNRYPGFHKSKVPSYPTGWYYEAGPSYRPVGGKTKIVFGTVSPPKELSIPLGEALAQLVKNKDNFTRNISDSIMMVSHIAKEINEGRISNVVDDKEVLKQLVKGRDNLYVAYQIMELLLTEPSMNTPEWFKNFNDIKPLSE